MKKEAIVIIFIAIVVLGWFYLNSPQPSLEPLSVLCNGGETVIATASGEATAAINSIYKDAKTERERQLLIRIAQTQAEYDATTKCLTDLSNQDISNAGLAAKEKCESQSRSLPDNKKVTCSLGTTKNLDPKIGEAQCHQSADTMICAVSCTKSIEYTCAEVVSSAVTTRETG